MATAWVGIEKRQKKVEDQTDDASFVSEVLLPPSVVFHELGRQISTNCIERAHLLNTIWRSVFSIFTRVLLNADTRRADSDSKTKSLIGEVSNLTDKVYRLKEAQKIEAREGQAREQSMTSSLSASVLRPSFRPQSASDGATLDVDQATHPANIPGFTPYRVRTPLNFREAAAPDRESKLHVSSSRV